MFSKICSITDGPGSSKKPHKPKGRPPNSLKNLKADDKTTSLKKPGMKKLGRPKNTEDQNGEKVPTGVLAKPDTARRISTRSKKPGKIGLKEMFII